jgi:hypothetical protein
LGATKSPPMIPGVKHSKASETAMAKWSHLGCD